MNGWDILIIALIVAVAAAAAVRIIKNKKQGKHNCGGDCATCSGCGILPDERK